MGADVARRRERCLAKLQPPLCEPGRRSVTHCRSERGGRTAWPSRNACFRTFGLRCSMQGGERPTRRSPGHGLGYSWPVVKSLHQSSSENVRFCVRMRRNKRSRLSEEAAPIANRRLEFVAMRGRSLVCRAKRGGGNNAVAISKQPPVLVAGSEVAICQGYRVAAASFCSGCDREATSSACRASALRRCKRARRVSSL